MICVLPGNRSVERWVRDRIPHVDNFGPSSSLGVVNDKGALIAGVVYHDFQPDYRSVQLSMAAHNPRWAKRDVIAALLHYPFGQLGCYRVFTLTPANNTMALRVNSHIGFQREGVADSMFGPNSDGVMMRLLKPEYETLYVRDNHGKECT